MSFIYELIGYTGSLLVAVSLMMKSVFRLRVINLIGALFFTVYGFFIHAFPVTFLNGLIVCVNIYYLSQMWNQKEYFRLMEVSYDSRYLKNFLEFYKKEISEFVPSYRFQPKPKQLVVFVLRNMIPVGVLIVYPTNKQAEIFLDFVLPDYRDFRAGKFLFEQSADYFREKGIEMLTSEAGNTVHESYLKRMGFELRDGLYCRTVREAALKDSHW